MILTIILIGLCVLVYFQNNKKEEILSTELQGMIKKIDDITVLTKGDFEGYLYFGRDSCPNCISLHNGLKNYSQKFPKFSIDMFDTDQWREHSEFQNILKRYGITAVPSLLKVGIDESIIFFSFPEDEKEIENALELFFHK